MYSKEHFNLVKEHFVQQKGFGYLAKKAYMAFIFESMLTNPSHNSPPKVYPSGFSYLHYYIPDTIISQIAYCVSRGFSNIQLQDKGSQRGGLRSIMAPHSCFMGKSHSPQHPTSTKTQTLTLETPIILLMRSGQPKQWFCHSLAIASLGVS